jgi:hypothetical protein
MTIRFATPRAYLTIRPDQNEQQPPKCLVCCSATPADPAFPCGSTASLAAGTSLMYVQYHDCDALSTPLAG